MITVIIDYAVISPATLECILHSAVPCLCNWVNIDQDNCEFYVFCEDADLAKVEKILAPYV